MVRPVRSAVEKLQTPPPRLVPWLKEKPAGTPDTV